MQRNVPAVKTAASRCVLFSSNLSVTERDARNLPARHKSTSATRGGKINLHESRRTKSHGYSWSRAKKGPLSLSLSHRGNLITRSLSLPYRVTSRLMHRDDREYASTSSVTQKFRCVPRGYMRIPTKSE